MKKQDLVIVCAVLLAVSAGLVYMNIKRKKEEQQSNIPGAGSTDKA